MGRSRAIWAAGSPTYGVRRPGGVRLSNKMLPGHRELQYQATNSIAIWLRPDAPTPQSDHRDISPIERIHAAVAPRQVTVVSIRIVCIIAIEISGRHLARPLSQPTLRLAAN